MDNKFLLYGAYGYTGTLIARMAREYGLRPLLAGRDETRLKALSEETGLDYEVLDLENREKLTKLLKDMPLVLHCAGPFVHTYRQVLEACLLTGTHYLDITGEIDVLEGLAGFQKEAENSGVMLLPGVGFDVVPTDCMAAYLSAKMPDATDLKLAIHNRSRASRGTMLTLLLALGKGGAIRKNGEILEVPHGHRDLNIDFGEGPLPAVTIPWGDVSTAYYTTGIPNIEVYMAEPFVSARAMKFSNYFRGLFRMAPVRSIMENRVRKGNAGPSGEDREKYRSRVWGKVTDTQGNSREAIFEGPEGYTLTAHTALMSVKRVLSGDFKNGFQTPAGVFGPDFIMGLKNTYRKDL